MEELTLTFSTKINVSLSPGDTVYFLNNDKTTELGVVTTVGTDGLSFNLNRSLRNPVPANTDYIFFSKKAEIESSGIIGYEATTTLVNTSTKRAELYAVSSEVFQSST